MSPARERRRDDLLLKLIATPTGLMIEDMMVELDATHPQVNEAIRDLRLYLGDYDQINVVCDPQGPGERWLYRLVGTLDEVRPWAANRVNDSISRIRTIRSMMSSIVKSTNGRTIEGRKARVTEQALRHLIEDLDLIEA